MSRLEAACYSRPGVFADDAGNLAAPDRSSSAVRPRPARHASRFGRGGNLLGRNYQPRAARHPGYHGLLLSRAGGERKLLPARIRLRPDTRAALPRGRSRLLRARHSDDLPPARRVREPSRATGSKSTLARPVEHREERPDPHFRSRHRPRFGTRPRPANSMEL
jgi:hypothetical protein